MCPNIDSEEGLIAPLVSYKTCLVKHAKNLPIKNLMQYNVFHFGRTHCMQKDGIAIGLPPATHWDTKMFEFYEITIL